MTTFNQNKTEDLKRNKKTQEVIDEVIQELLELKALTKSVEKNNLPMDLSDVGNSIGLAIEKYIIENEDLAGFDIEGFLAGINHGRSIANGTHG